MSISLRQFLGMGEDDKLKIPFNKAGFVPEELFIDRHPKCDLV